MNRQRYGCPLVLLNAAVVVGVKKCQLRILVERVLLEVKPRRIDVRAKDPHPFLERLSSYYIEDHRLLHPDRINLIPCLQRFTVFNNLPEIAETCTLRTGNCLRGELPLRLAAGKRILIILAEPAEALKLLCCICFPSVLPFHSLFLLLSCKPPCQLPVPFSGFWNRLSGTISCAVCQSRGFL